MLCYIIKCLQITKQINVSQKGAYIHVWIVREMSVICLWCHGVYVMSVMSLHMYVMAVMAHVCMSWLWWSHGRSLKPEHPLVGSSILAASLYKFYKSLAAMLCMSWLWWHMPMCVCRGCDGLMPDCQKYIQRYGARFSESRSKNLHTTIATPSATPLATPRMHLSMGHGTLLAIFSLMIMVVFEGCVLVSHVSHLKSCFFY